VAKDFHHLFKLSQIGLIRLFKKEKRIEILQASFLKQQKIMLEWK
jgi:hypothetical protein